MNFTIIWWDFAGTFFQKDFELWGEAVDYEMSLIHEGYGTSGVMGDMPPHIGDDLPF